MQIDRIEGAQRCSGTRFAWAARLVRLAVWTLAIAVSAGSLPALAADAAADDQATDSDPCDRKGRLRGPVFAKGSANVMPEALVALDLIAEGLKTRCTDVVILIESHTDTYGDPGYNLRLSEVRAREIKRLLVERGVPGERLETVGYGEKYPLATGLSQDVQALNRRVTFVPKGAASHPLPE
jgi:outer membrane protein OmpA-like peptidoglycan-associated protein